MSNNPIASSYGCPEATIPLQQVIESGKVSKTLKTSKPISEHSIKPAQACKQVIKTLKTLKTLLCPFLAINGPIQ